MTSNSIHDNRSSALAMGQPNGGTSDQNGIMDQGNASPILVVKRNTRTIKIVCERTLPSGLEGGRGPLKSQVMRIQNGHVAALIHKPSFVCWELGVFLFLAWRKASKLTLFTRFVGAIVVLGRGGGYKGRWGNK